MPIASSTSLDIVEAEDLLPPKIGVVVLAVTVTEILSPICLWRSALILAVQIMVMKKRSDDTIYVVAVAVVIFIFVVHVALLALRRCVALHCFAVFLVFTPKFDYLIVLILWIYEKRTLAVTRSLGGTQVKNR